MTMSAGNRRKALAFGLILVGALASLPIGHAMAQGSKVVTIGQSTDPRTLDPAGDTAFSSISTMLNVYDTLITRGTGDTFLPALAESWTLDDPTTLTLKLRHGVKFHNGDAFTAQDVVFTYKRYADTKAQFDILAQVKGLYDSVEAVDDYTVRLKMPRPQATILANIARLPILPKKAFEAAGNIAFGQAPVGTGPFKFVEWKKNEQIVLDAYADYWRGRAQVDRLVVKPIPEDFTRFAAFKTGQVDIIVNVAAKRVKEIEADPKLKIEATRSMRNVYVAFNTFEKPFSDVRVRRALNHAIDVPAIVDAVLDGRAYVNPAACDGLVVGHDPKIKAYEYDPALAKKLLAEAGYPNGFTTEFWGPVGRFTQDKEIQEAIAGQLAEVGITVKHVQPEWAQFIRQFLNADIKSIAFNGVGNSLADCDQTMSQRIDSARGSKRFYHTETVDKLIAAELQEMDPTKRTAIFSQIQQQMHDDAAWIFLYDQQDIYGVNARINWKARSDEMIWGYDISFVK